MSWGDSHKRKTCISHNVYASSEVFIPTLQGKFCFSDNTGLLNLTRYALLYDVLFVILI